MIDPNLKIFICKRFTDEEDEKWQGALIVLATSEEEVKNLIKKSIYYDLDEFKEVVVKEIDKTKFIWDDYSR